MGRNKKLLPFDERLKTAAQLLTRAKIFFDVWWLYESSETRPKILDTMNSYPEFFRFDSHAHFVAMIIHVGMLFETRNNTINVPGLISEAKADSNTFKERLIETEMVFKTVRDIPSKIAILRSNLFAHRSDMISYKLAFEKASLTPDQIRALLDVGLHIVNALLSWRRLPQQGENDAARIHTEKMLEKLAGHKLGLRNPDALDEIFNRAENLKTARTYLS